MFGLTGGNYNAALFAANAETVGEAGYTFATSSNPLDVAPSVYNFGNAVQSTLDQIQNPQISLPEFGGSATVSTPFVPVQTVPAQLDNTLDFSGGDFSGGGSLGAGFSGDSSSGDTRPQLLKL